MVNITIDKSACIMDGLCSTICPLQIILPPKVNHVPEPKPGFSKWCISCGHCVAICPTGALRHSRMAPKQCSTIDYQSTLSWEQIEQTLRLRRSIRRFKETIPKKEVVERLIGLAGCAPSGHNLQPIRWQVFTNRVDLDRLVDMVCNWMTKMLDENPDLPQAPFFKKIVKAWSEGVDLVLHQTPVLIMAHSRTRTGTEATDTAIALSYIDLASLSLGLGCCWAGLIKMGIDSWEPLRKFIDLPHKHQLYGAMMVGYPKYEFQRVPLRNHSDIKWR